MKSIGYVLAVSLFLLPLKNSFGQNYSNNLGDSQSVDQDFNDYSSTASAMLGYNFGNFTVTNNRLEFTTQSSWLGIKTLKTTANLNQSWSTQVKFSIKNLSGLYNGNYYNIGIALAMGSNFSDAFPNRLVLKASQDIDGRSLGFKIYYANSELGNYEDNNSLNTFTDGVLKIEYNADTQLFTGYFKKADESKFTSLGIWNANWMPGWNPNGNSLVNISIFSGSQPYSSTSGFASINSGDIYLANFELSSSVQSGDFIYYVSEGDATITGYRGPGNSVTVPSQIDGYFVKTIGREVFKNNLNITNVTFESGIISIGDDLFYGCANLTTAYMPNSIVNIGGGVFAFCKNLTSVTLSENIQNLPQYIFL